MTRVRESPNGPEKHGTVEGFRGLGFRVSDDVA